MGTSANEHHSCYVRRSIALLPSESVELDPETRKIVERIRRLLVEMREGRGLTAHIAALRSLAAHLEEAPTAGETGRSLRTLLEEGRDDFLGHVQSRSCSYDKCFERPAAPCQQACPAHIDIPTFVALIGEGKYAEATEVILRDMPFPWACGLICPHPCEDACLRSELDEPVNIRLMKAYSARMASDGGQYPRPTVKQRRPEKVAVIGSGPAGLSAAYFLALAGYPVTVFEKLPMAGGMLRYGIPAYRLPKDVLDREIAYIERLGVEIRTGTAFGEDVDLDRLREGGFAAFFFAVGLSQSRSLGLEGEDLDGVLGGVDFLRSVALEEARRLKGRVVVVGGGNVAVDVARTAVRYGAGEVHLACLEARDQMPAWSHEVLEAEEEGIRIHNSWGPARMTGRDGRLEAVEFRRCTTVFDDQGRFNPAYDESERMTLEAETVILAVGQGADTGFASGAGLLLGRGGGLQADPETGATELPGVFAGGDVVYGPRMVVDAVAAGKRAAVGIDAHLRRVEPPSRICPPQPRGEAGFLLMTGPEKCGLARACPSPLAVEERVCDFRQVEPDLSDEMAFNEARRCLRCDRCRGDGLCMMACREMGASALEFSETPADRLAFLRFADPESRCIGCGSCAAACPQGNIEVTDEDGRRRITFCGTRVADLALERCTGCGRPYATKAFLDLVKRRADEAGVADVAPGLCPECARKRRAFAIAGEIGAIR